MNKVIHNNRKIYNNLTEYLLSMGVPPYKIEQSKIDLVKKESKYEELELCYDLIKEEELNYIKVPVSNIHDVAREGITKHNVSWYDHMNYALFGINGQYKNGLITRKFDCLFDIYKNNSYSKLIELFQEDDSYLSEHYFSAYEHPNMPTKYYQRSDGSHRLSIAKVIGVDYLYGKATDVYRLNEVKYKYYLEIKSLLKDLYDLLDKVPLLEYKRHCNYITFNSNTICYTQGIGFNWKISINHEKYSELDSFINNLTYIVDTLTELIEAVDFNNNKYRSYSKLRMIFKRYYYRFHNYYILSDFHDNNEPFIDYILFNIAHKEAFPNDISL
ncbi:hypothetical protein ACFYSI_13095 [Staphylococcus xylosus]|uniref:hypothetical protein n=1 Tax=Staphylococcus xylosus TaxID=1288 RepID=UPI003682F99D